MSCLPGCVVCLPQICAQVNTLGIEVPSPRGVEVPSPRGVEVPSPRGVEVLSPRSLQIFLALF